MLSENTLVVLHSIHCSQVHHRNTKRAASESAVARQTGRLSYAFRKAFSSVAFRGDPLSEDQSFLLRFSSGAVRCVRRFSGSVLLQRRGVHGERGVGVRCVRRHRWRQNGHSSRCWSHFSQHPLQAECEHRATISSMFVSLQIPQACFGSPSASPSMACGAERLAAPRFADSADGNPAWPSRSRATLMAPPPCWAAAPSPAAESHAPAAIFLFCGNAAAAADGHRASGPPVPHDPACCLRATIVRKVCLNRSPMKAENDPTSSLLRVPRNSELAHQLTQNT